MISKLQKLISRKRDEQNNIAVLKAIPVENILMGAEGDILTGISYVKMTGSWKRTSTRCSDGPHVAFLKLYTEVGNACLNPEIFKTTDYYKNALECIHYFGEYFPYVRRPEDIIITAKRFIDMYESKDVSAYPTDGHNSHGECIEVRPIKGTSLYQLKSGNHRTAFAAIDRQEYILAKIYCNEETSTYFQEIVEGVSWDGGIELYQPIELPEFSNWMLIRNSKDRVGKITSWLSLNNISTNGKSILDVGSYFGWFISEYKQMGFEAFGLERDIMACEFSEKYFGIAQSNLFKMPIETFLEKHADTQFDFVSFLSVLHHFAMGRSYLTAAHVFQKFSKMTRKVMFFETGEEHEEMFGGALSGWDEEQIEKFIRENSDFSQIIRLGRDSDNKGKYSKDYQRMLFVLVK